MYICVFGYSLTPFPLFLQFSGTTLALFLQTRARTVLCTPCSRYLEPFGCCLQHFLRGSPGSSEHECSKPRKTPKNTKKEVFSVKCYLFRIKTLHRVSLHSQNNGTDLNQRFPLKKVHFQNFRHS